MLKEYFAIAIRSVMAHKIRALLTTLGVIIGVSSVILLMSLGNSAREEAANQIRGIGSNLIFVNIIDDDSPSRPKGVASDAHCDGHAAFRAFYFE